MITDRFSLSGKTVLVTGAAGLLGFEHACAVLEKGARVILVDIDIEKLEIRKDDLSREFDAKSVITKPADVSCEEAITDLCSELSKNSIDVNVLINNAALDAKVGSDLADMSNTRLENYSVFEWQRHLDVGLTGTFICSKIFGRRMAFDLKSGVIVNIASDLSVISPDQRLYRLEGVSEEYQPVKAVPYSAVKSALVGLTKYVATYWADYGVRCNALSPGGIFNGQDERFVSKVSKLIPIGRMATRDEYRGCLQFLCSDASSYLTGQNIIVDGGRSIW